MPQNVKLLPYASVITLPQYLLSEQRERILIVLQSVMWNYKAAGDLLGLTYRAMRYRVEQSGLIDKEHAGRIRPYPKPDGLFAKRWARVRWQALKRDQFRCQACGAAAKQGATLHVDHIKPRSRFPELELELSNLQVLCEPCNLSKSDE